MAATFQQAEAFGTLAHGLGHRAGSDVRRRYASLPPHLQSQLSELQAESNRRRGRRAAILSFDRCEISGRRDNVSTNDP